MSETTGEYFRKADTEATKTPVRIGLVGATGLIGRRIIHISSHSEAARIVGIARREIEMPVGTRMEVFIASPDKWGEVFEAVRPRALICALGTTIKKVGGDEDAFRAVDQEMVLSTANAAHEAGVPNVVLVSAAGANPGSKNFYMRVKGETENLVTKVGFKRLDILRPGLLKGARNDDFRMAEGIAKTLSPIIDPLLPKKWEMFRSVDADLVAEAALGLAIRRAQGRFIHDNDAMKRAAREWRMKAGIPDTEEED